MSGIRERQRRYRELMLGMHMQHLATRHQDLELWAGRQYVYYLYACDNHLLKVVQEEEHVLVLHLLLHVLKQGLAGYFADVKRLSNGGHNERGIADGGQVHEKDAIGEAVTQLSCHLQAQAGLARATRTCQGEQAHILAAQQLLNGCQLLLAPNERCELDRQVIGVRVECFERRKVSRQVCNDELREVALLL